MSPSLMRDISVGSMKAKVLQCTCTGKTHTETCPAKIWLSAQVKFLTAK